LLLTQIPGSLYIDAMAAEQVTAAERPKSMLVLEERVRDLIGLCERLRQENHLLRKQQSSWQAERADLIEKNAQVRSRVEAMILRLKAME
jgi:cell division protein ZapB